MNQLPDPGDLYVVIHVCGCPASLQYLGFMDRARAVIVPPISPACAHCGASNGIQELIDSEHHRFLRAWTRRIPGLNELEAVDIHTELEQERPRVREVA